MESILNLLAMRPCIISVDHRIYSSNVLLLCVLLQSVVNLLKHMWQLAPFYSCVRH
jgi:hypothetical protein